MIVFRSHTNTRNGHFSLFSKFAFECNLWRERERENNWTYKCAAFVPVFGVHFHNHNTHASRVTILRVYCICITYPSFANAESMYVWRTRRKYLPAAAFGYKLLYNRNGMAICVREQRANTESDSENEGRTGMWIIIQATGRRNHAFDITIHAFDTISTSPESVHNDIIVDFKHLFEARRWYSLMSIHIRNVFRSAKKVPFNTSFNWKMPTASDFSGNWLEPGGKAPWHPPVAKIGLQYTHFPIILCELFTIHIHVLNATDLGSLKTDDKDESKMQPDSGTISSIHEKISTSF